MEVTVLTHPAMAALQPSGDVPERPERLQAAVNSMQAADLPLSWIKAPGARRADLQRVHTRDHIAGLFSAEPEEGVRRIDNSTMLSPGSINAALRAAGAVVEAVRRVGRGELDRAFCAVRPPGHHAEPAKAMGFCLFGNVAIGARTALSLGFQRVGVIDFDVHHGNGTEAALRDDPRLFFGSIYQSPLWPGTGEPSASASTTVVNTTVPPGAPRELWRRTFEADLMPRLDAFQPDLILISAGFDAHRRDPLADQALEAQDFGWMTEAILCVARRNAHGRVVSSLEGGYDLEALGTSTVEHVRALVTG